MRVSEAKKFRSTTAIIREFRRHQNDNDNKVDNEKEREKKKTENVVPLPVPGDAALPAASASVAQELDGASAAHVCSGRADRRTTPLIIAGGAFWPPLAVAIAGGVLGATLIAITLVPAAHGVVARRMVA